MPQPKPKKQKTSDELSTWPSIKVKIKNDEKSEKLKKTLELILQYCENGCIEKEDSLYSSDVAGRFGKNDAKLLPTSNDIMNVLRGCLISHRFLDAARILELLSMEIARKDHVIFKGGLEVLENHPDATPDLMEYFTRNVLSLGHLNKREVVLEYMMYCLKNEQPQQIQPLIQLLLRNKRNLKQNSVIDPVFKAYSALVAYVAWGQIKEQDDVQEAEMERLKDKIVSTFSEVLTLEGQWDIFVPKLIEVLEFYNEVDDGEAILEKHLEANRRNINAHVFLYEYLKKHGRKENQQLECLKSMSRISPSDPLVLELAFNLQDDKREKALRLLLKFVDYADNKNNLECWKMLAEIGVSVLKSQSVTGMNVLQNMWTKSSSYWPLYHFDPTTISVQNKDDAKLLLHKSIFLAIIQDPKKNKFIAAAELSLENHPKYKNKLKKMLSRVQILNTSHFTCTEATNLH